jgi:transaldolase
MAATTLEQLEDLGQSVWLDFISRPLITSGRLAQLIDKGLLGMTSNPTIFDKALSAGEAYEDQLRQLARAGKSTFEIYDDVSIKDIQDAADAFKEVYERTAGLDGYVSLEINPKLAYHTSETIKEGRRLAKKVDRPNVMFKVPATDAGYEAIAALLAEGINVNTTLIFSVGQYQKTAAAYLKGMKELLSRRGNSASVHSVASVFVSRVDTMVDTLLDELLAQEAEESRKTDMLALKGTAAVANANLIYREYRRAFSGDLYAELQSQGVPVQRLLWGSTGTKNPAYSDIKYVTELLARNTVNTLPEATIEAFLDHGVAKITMTENTDSAERILRSLADRGIDIDDVCVQLLRDGVVAFERSFDSLLNTISERTGG